MIQFRTVANYALNAVDLLPVINFFKNSAIILYNLAHKVNLVANPVQNSWKTALKIYALSRSNLLSAAIALPVIGNVIALVYYVRNAFYRMRNCWAPGVSLGSLNDAILADWSKNPRSEEVFRLCLSQHQQFSKEELFEALKIAELKGNTEAFKQLLDIDSWTPDELVQIVRDHHLEFAKLAFPKLSAHLNEKVVENLLREVNKRLLKKEAIVSFLTIHPPTSSIVHNILTQWPDFFTEEELCDMIVPLAKSNRSAAQILPILLLRTWSSFSLATFIQKSANFQLTKGILNKYCNILQDSHLVSLCTYFALSEIPNSMNLSTLLATHRPLIQEAVLQYLQRVNPIQGNLLSVQILSSQSTQGF